MQEKQGQTGTETAEADHAVAGERAGRARLERLRGVFAEKQPLGLGGEKLPDIEEIDAAARNAGSEGGEERGPSDEEDGVEVGEAVEVGAGGGERELDEVVGEQRTERRRAAAGGAGGKRGREREKGRGVVERGDCE